MLENDAAPVRHVVRLEVGGIRLAIPAASVREVVGALGVMRVPGGPAGLVGVVPWNGRAIAVLDLVALLEGSPDRELRPRTLVVETDGTTLAIPIDRAHEPSPPEASRPAHAVRMPHARLEVDLAGSTLPLFEPTEFLRSVTSASLAPLPATPW